MRRLLRGDIEKRSSSSRRRTAAFSRLKTWRLSLQLRRSGRIVRRHSLYGCGLVRGRSYLTLNLLDGAECASSARRATCIDHRSGKAWRCRPGGLFGVRMIGVPIDGLLSAVRGPTPADDSSRSGLARGAPAGRAAWSPELSPSGPLQQGPGVPGSTPHTFAPSISTATSFRDMVTAPQRPCCPGSASFLTARQQN
jgi:hypothetical protein